MNILFISLLEVDINDGSSIYGSVLKELKKDGHNLFIVSNNERRFKKPTSFEKRDGISYLRVRTGNIQKTNTIEKGISTLLLEKQYEKAIKKYSKNIKFDLILYSTPPITFCNVIKFFKKRDNAKTYLMLKDIFPQNAVDLRYFSKNSIIYKYFRRKEVNLYKLSDRIGCMSPANKKYLLKNNSYIDENSVEIFPNSITPNKNNKRNMSANYKIRKKYRIPENATVFMYGGNLGKPQGINFVAECLKAAKDINNVYFVVCGNGTEYKVLESVKQNNQIDNLILINGLPKEEYSELLNIADIGLVFLDYGFTIPNYPSRILSYCEKGIPILCCTDKNTDIGKIAKKNNYGWNIDSNDVHIFLKAIENIVDIPKESISKMGENAYMYLVKNFNSKTNAKQLLINKEQK